MSSLNTAGRAFIWIDPMNLNSSLSATFVRLEHTILELWNLTFTNISELNLWNVRYVPLVQPSKIVWLAIWGSNMALYRSTSNAKKNWGYWGGTHFFRNGNQFCNKLIFFYVSPNRMYFFLIYNQSDSF